MDLSYVHLWVWRLYGICRSELYVDVKCRPLDTGPDDVGLSWWFLADVVIRVPVQVGIPLMSINTVLADDEGVLCREGLADNRSIVLVRRPAFPLVVSNPNYC
jgi:hypothetical protein